MKLQRIKELGDKLFAAVVWIVLVIGVSLFVVAMMYLQFKIWSIKHPGAPWWSWLL